MVISPREWLRDWQDESHKKKNSPLPPDRFFRIDDLKKDLKGRSVRGGTATVLSQAANFVLRFASTAVLARLLTPYDYGLVAMTVVVTGFAGLFRDAGLSWATVQREKISHDQVSTLFWINAALGGLISLIVAAISPAVALFYGEPRLSWVTCGLAGTFLLGGLGVQHQALLRRQMRFRTLAIIEVVSTFFGIFAAIVMAYTGFKYWSLVGMALVQALAAVVLTWLTMPWRPGAPRRGSGVGPLLRFGYDILWFNVVNYFSRNADNLLIGHYWGAGPLALYDKAYNLLLLPVNQINAPVSAVAVPALSRAKIDPERFRRYFFGALQIICSFVTPIILLIAIFADEVVQVWLGSQWLDCAPLFRFLSLAALLGALSNPLGWFLISAGLTRRYRQIGVFSAAVIVSAFASGLSFGPRGVAMAYSTAMCLITVPAWAWALNGTGIRLQEVLTTLAMPLVSGAVAALTVVGFVKLMTGGIYAACLGGVVFCLVYAFVLLVIFRQWSFFLSIAKAWRQTGATEVFPL